MSSSSISSPATRAKRAFSVRRPAAWLAALASDPKTSLSLVVGFAAAHAVLWTLVLVNLKSGQDVHMDVAEAYAWGQKFLLGYGKHPPLSGWIAGVWFRLFPVADWSSYALAMATLACALVICWQLSLRVVDRRRAFFVVVMLALYPIFNFKGFKYNPDLLQLVTLPLVVLAYLDAFARRTVKSGVWLGLAGALALMTKYWALTMIGAVGLAALIHPDRLRFLRAPAPWIAIATMVVAMLPHLVWLKQVDFVPLTYAGDTYSLTDRVMIADLAIGYVKHNLALLALPVILGAIALASRPFGWPPLPFLSRGANASVDISQALNVWIIQAVVAIGPPLGAVLFHVYIKTDWGIPLFFLTPLALIALPPVRVRKTALVSLAAIWLVISLVVLAASPRIVAYELSEKRTAGATYRARSELARELTEIWRLRFNSRWPVVAAYTDTGQPVTFYSPDHPAPLTPDEPWSSGLTSLDEAKRSGFIGICETGDWKLERCEKWMTVNAANAERMVMTTRRFFLGLPGPATAWNIFIVPPAR
jgi:uncharacterized membrane protein (UPF0136 family)